MRFVALLSVSLFSASAAPAAALEGGGQSVAESRALAYLAREVPRWRAENGCLSCHNNGDAARALYRAAGLGEPVPAASLAETTRWLEEPGRWDHNGGEGPFSDKVLARVQFAATLASAIEAGRSKDRAALVRAAERVAGDQEADGSWRVDAEGNVGSPATYGPCLATVMARATLQAADPARFRAAVGRADCWLRKAPAASVLDAAAVLIGTAGADDRPAVDQRRRCLDLIRRAEAPRGGWGPFVNAPPEAFDTAVVLLALTRSRDVPDRGPMIRRGRAFLVAAQRPDGSWPETTRPPAGESYAQRISTAGWALLALLETREGSRGKHAAPAGDEVPPSGHDTPGIIRVPAGPRRDG
jgi:hypothetical protein